MTIPSLAGSGAPLFRTVLTDPSVVCLFAFSLLVAVGIYRHKPPLPQTAVWGLVPWFVTGSSLQILATRVQYPPQVVPLFATPWAYLAMAAVAGLVWLLGLTVSTSRRTDVTVHYYVGAMGVGTTITVWSSLVPHIGDLVVSRVLVYVILLSLGFSASAVITVSLGFLSVDFIQYTLVTGSFVVFGALMRGTATVANVLINGPAAHTTVSAGIRGLASTVRQYGWVTLDGTYLWAWLLLVAYLGVAILIATGLAPYARRRPRPVHAVLGIVGGIGVVFGFTDLVLVVVG